MSRKHLWISATIIACVIFISFALSVPHTRDVSVGQSLAETASIPLVTLRDSFRKGVHTISGSFEAPNACMTVSAEATLVGNASSPGNILVAISMQSDPGICLQLPTRASFETTITAPADLQLRATVNGIVATTTS